MNYSKIVLLFILSFVFLNQSNAQLVSISGTASYYDVESSTQRPIQNARIHTKSWIDIVNGTFSDFDTYTDVNGDYLTNTYQHPTQVISYLYFKNDKIDLRGRSTSRSVYTSLVDLGTFGDGCSEETPCSFEISVFHDLNFDFVVNENENNYATIFMLGNEAANFSLGHGYTPSTPCIIKYPAETSILDGWSLPLTASFFWPEETMPAVDLAGDNWLTDIIGFLGGGELTENTIYLQGSVVNLDKHSTVYHEYGHFLMKERRGSWPLTLDDYRNGVPFRHSQGNTNQDERLAYLEGWADFYGSAVQSWITDPSNPYTGAYQDYNYIMEKPEWEFSAFTNVTNGQGYKNEIMVGSLLFDFYDPQITYIPNTSGQLEVDNIQTPFTTMLDAIAQTGALTTDYVKNLMSIPSITDLQRHIGISVLNTAKMDPVASYGNVSVKVKNDFESGDVILGKNVMNFEQINTDALPHGTVDRSRLWMDDLYLNAIENQYDPQGYPMKFQHTHPFFPEKTWTTELSNNNNFTNIWNTYNEQYTYKANFDRECNVVINYQSLDGFTLPTGSTTTSRSRTLLNLTAPDLSVNGVDNNFFWWSDGSTESLRNFTVNEHINLTALYKAHLQSSSTVPLGTGTQRRIIKTSRDNADTYNMYYESGNSLWFTKSTNNGNTWNPETFVRELTGDGTIERELRLIPDSSGAFVLNVSDFVTDLGDGTYDHTFWLKADNTDIMSLDNMTITGGSFYPSPIAVMTKPNSSPYMPSILVSLSKQQSSGFKFGLGISPYDYNHWNSTTLTQGTNANTISLQAVTGTGPNGSPGWLLYIVWDEPGTSGGIKYMLGFLPKNPAHWSPLPADIMWYGPVTIASNGTMNMNPALGVDADGKAYIAWEYRNGSVGSIKTDKRDINSSLTSLGTKEFSDCATANNYATSVSFSPSVSTARYTNSPLNINNVFTLSWYVPTKGIIAAQYTSNNGWESPAIVSASGSAPLTSDQITGSSGKKVSYVSQSGSVYTLNVLELPTSTPYSPAPTLASPASGATGQSLTATLNWDCVVGVTAYHLQVDNEATFASPIAVFNANVTGTSYSLSGLSANTTYYWRVSAVNSVYEGSFSSSRSFTTGGPPAAPTLVTPADGGSNLTSPVTFSWNQVSGAETYNLFYSQDPNFEDGVFHYNNITATAITTAIDYNGTYYWHVLASNSFGPGDFSSDQSFTIVSGFGAPTFNGGTYSSGGINYPKLYWSRVSQATNYKLYRYYCNNSSQDCENYMQQTLIYSGNDTVIVDYGLFVGASSSNSRGYYYVKAYKSDGSSSAKSSKKWYYVQLDSKTGLGRDNEDAELPLTNKLLDNFPNPFNPTTTIYYNLSEDSHVKIVVVNTLGEEVATLVDEFVSAGYKSVTFDASALPSGVYFYRMQSGLFSDMKKMLLIR